jgi:diguanylate cyclase
MPVCIACIDIDNFKRLNDQRGHVEGDRFLKKMAHAIGETLRASDVAGRLGGMAWFEVAPDAPEQLLDRADEAMYAAKAAGKHRFALWTASSTRSELQG